MADLPAKSALSGLAGRVLADVRDLARETANLLRQAKESSHKTSRIGGLLVAGAGTIFIGAILICLMLVHLLARLLPEQPMWMWYGAVGIPVLAVGVVLAASGRSRMKTLHPLQQQSAKVMRDATEAAEHIGETVESARQSLHETAESVREALDLREQFNKRPWLLIGGAASVGYVGGALLHHDGSRRNSASEHVAAKDMARYRGMLARLAAQLAPEVAQLKGLALGTLLGIVRDHALKSTPHGMERDVEDLINGLTVKLGGSPVHSNGGAPSGANGTSHSEQ